ncbi:hypothetical protein PENTCL1PPCAC_25219 [Pristionchus entomophagus]|uniref:Uncharacterized protein n=1 Tax=Pristionchus entomophagus TaxID=358040 RepID=A0AAV5UA19_9BILA|nr:hypothetical protein PENTCL1PPCAC_25219 [Pristionchus entomophagus]
MVVYDSVHIGVRLFKRTLPHNASQIHSHLSNEFLVFGHQLFRLILGSSIKCDHVLKLSPILRSNEHDDREEGAGDEVLDGSGRVEEAVLLLPLSDAPNCRFCGSIEEFAQSTALDEEIT